jgi:hypothetical protein
MRDTQCVAQHRAQRGDPGASGDEEKSAFGRVGREREAADRTVDVDRLADPQRQVRTGRAFRIDADEQLQKAEAIEYGLRFS